MIKRNFSLSALYIMFVLNARRNPKGSPPLLNPIPMKLNNKSVKP